MKNCEVDQIIITQQKNVMKTAFRIHRGRVTLFKPIFRA